MECGDRGHLQGRRRGLRGRAACWTLTWRCRCV
uniref:Uncharacterized protein n=1 Tax=Arundo donax TaxID=35708 RepID=A0A0A9BHF7_ARUDO